MNTKRSVFAAKGLFAGLIALAPGQVQSQAPTQDSLPARQHIIESVTEDIKEARGVEFRGSKGGPECNQLTNQFLNANAPVRAGKTAFKHWVATCGERAELAMKRTQIGGTYWYGWSLYLPKEIDFSRHKTIVMQMASYPTPRNGKFPCGGNGHHITVSSSGELSFALQHAGETKDMECDHFSLGDTKDWKGQWIDFVMHAKWTGDKDGFVHLWMKTGAANYAQKIDYRGRTWWNDEDKGPYFKMGAYMGDPKWQGQSPCILYTDEYRMGSDKARFEDVAPGGEAAPVASAKAEQQLQTTAAPDIPDGLQVSRVERVF